MKNEIAKLMDELEALIGGQGKPPAKPPSVLLDSEEPIRRVVCSVDYYKTISDVASEGALVFASDDFIRRLAYVDWRISPILPPRTAVFYSDDTGKAIAIHRNGEEKML